MDGGAAMKKKNQVASEANEDFQQMTGTEQPGFKWRYCFHEIWIRVIEFFAGPKPPKVRHNDNLIAETAEALINTLISDSNPETIKQSKELLAQHRMQEDTRARRRLERWATRVISVYLSCVFLIIVANGIVMVINKRDSLISSEIMIAILTTTTVNILGLGFIVLKGHFRAAKEE